MSSKRLFIICWFLLLTSLHYGQSCGPAEIGREYNITSSATVPSGAFVLWMLYERVILYDSATPMSNRYPAQYVASRTQLTILNVSKNDGTVFDHVVDGYLVYNCTPSVYKRSSISTFESVTLPGNQIQTRCTSAQVYPQAKCQFSLKNGGTDKRVIEDGTSYITYTHTDPQPGGNEYYNTSCTLQYPVDGLKPGNWTVQVNMYPDLTGVSLAQGTTGQAPNTLTLSVPTVNIDSSNCPKGLTEEGDRNVRQGYIRQGEQASCMCVRAHAGNPPGKISWSTTQGGNFATLAQNEDETTIQINSPDNFTCQSISVLDGSHSVTYTPKYAYGPNTASLTFQRPGPIYSCPNQQTNINITCQVPANSSNPAILFTIQDGNGNNLVTKIPGDNMWYKSINYNFTKPGQHTFKCRVENRVFSDMFSETRASAIEVYEPPSDPPKIFARSNQNGDILVVGDDVTVICDVQGGYPTVHSVTLTCGHDQTVMSASKDGTSAQLTLNNIQQTCNAINCTCQATHVTGCYDLINVLPLTVFSFNPYQTDKYTFTTAELVGEIIGVIVGTLVFEAVIALIVFFIRRERRKRKNRTKDTEYDKVRRQAPLPYQNITHHDPNYQTVNPTEQAPNSASVNHETDRTYRNQAYGDYEEPIEIDTNAYSEIQTD